MRRILQRLHTPLIASPPPYASPAVAIRSTDPHHLAAELNCQSANLPSFSFRALIFCALRFHRTISIGPRLRYLDMVQ